MKIETRNEKTGAKFKYWIRYLSIYKPGCDGETVNVLRYCVS